MEKKPKLIDSLITVTDNYSQYSLSRTSSLICSMQNLTIIWIITLMSKLMTTKMIVRKVGSMPVSTNNFWMLTEIVIEIVALQINRTSVNKVETNLRMIRER